MESRKLPVGIENFEEIRTEGFYYVDKTGLIRDLLNNWGKVNLFTRPRRFGKSLTVSTFQAIFEGRRRLFAGLAIEPAWDWTKTWPVLRLDMGSCQAASIEAFWDKLGDLLISVCVETVHHGSDR